MLLGTAPMSHMVHMVVEALDAVATPRVRDRILETALGEAGLPAVPESGSLLGRFVHQHLGPTVEVMVGAQDAEYVLHYLEPFVRMAAEQEDTSDVYPTARALISERPTRAAPTDEVSFAGINDEQIPEEASFADINDEEITEEASFADINDDEVTEAAVTNAALAEPLLTGAVVTEAKPTGLPESKRPTVRPPLALVDLDLEMLNTVPPPSAKPTLLVASADPDIASELRVALGERVHVLHAKNAVGLLETVESSGSSIGVVVVDQGRPALHLEALTSLSSSFEPGTPVLFWGDTKQTEVADLIQENEGWRQCEAECSQERLATRCALLLDVSGPR